MKDLYLIFPDKISSGFAQIIEEATSDYKLVTIDHALNIPDLRNKRILFAVELDECGFNFSLFKIFYNLQKKGKEALANSQGALIVQSQNQLFTKNMARRIVFLSNLMGCKFFGHPLVEATNDLSNFITWQKIYGNLSLREIYQKKANELVNRLVNERRSIIKDPKLLVLHSSSYKTSNTLQLWQMVKRNLAYENTKELHVENGTIVDCRGCSYHTCIHYSEEKSCFYGGVMVEEILPAIEEADFILWLCPNYNDALSAKLMAVINRLTVLYKRVNFGEKTIFSIIVSGNSGSDCLAEQIIGALNINKGFNLPSYFSLMASANDPDSIRKIKGIEKRAEEFARRIYTEIENRKKEINATQGD